MLHSIFHLFGLNKGKGILIFLYLLITNIVSVLAIASLQYGFGGIFYKADDYTVEGVAFLLAAVWVYLTKDNYYRDESGDRQQMRSVNSFAFINMAGWALIFFALSLMFFLNSIFDYFTPCPL